MALLNLTDSNFTDEVLKSELPVLVDFWAPWCAPCRLIAGVIEDLDREYKDRLKIGKINVDENPKAPSRYGVMSIPMLILFKDGQVIDQALGALNKQQLKEKIDQYI